MLRLSTLAPTRTIKLSLSVLAALFTLGLTSLTPAQAADKGYITAKTWYDSSNSSHPYAIGDGVSDDTKNLQDLINYGLFHAEAIQLEPGIYRITKTLLITDTVANDQKIGFRLSGIGGPDMSPYNGPPPGGPRGGVAIVLDASATGQLAILQVGVGAFYDMTIENIGLVSNVPSTVTSTGTVYGTKYGLLFGGQNFSHAIVHAVTVNGADTAFAIDATQTGTPGGNGESVDLDECRCVLANCFYYNNSPAAQALGHSLAKCGGGINNGGSMFRFGTQGAGYGVEITSSLFSFLHGPLRDTLIECDNAPANVIMTGGRIERADTFITYSGGTNQLIGRVIIRGVDFDATDVYIPSGSSNWVTKSFPLIDNTLNGTVFQPNVQYTNTIEQCRINGNYSAPYPAISLVGIANDNSRTYFDRDTFTGFSNSLVDPNNGAPVTGLQNLHVKVRDCRENQGQTGSVPFTDISYP